MSRRFLLRSSLAWAGLAAVGCAAPPTASPSAPAAASSSGAATSAAAVAAAVPTATTPLNVKGAWVALTSNQMIWPVAKEAGYFDKYNVNMDLNYINGSTTAIPALLSSDIDMGQIAGSTVVSAQAGGSDIVMVLGFVNQSVFRVIVPPSITNIADLKGKSVGVTKIGNTDYFMWQAISEHQGWGPNDLNYVNSGDVPGQIALLVQGAVQGIAVTPPNNIQAIEAGGNEILDTASLNVAEQQVGMVVTRRYLAANRPAVLAVAKASVEAIARWKKDQPFVEGIIKKYLQTDDEQVASVGWSAYADILPQAPFPSLDGFTQVIKEVSTQNDAAASLVPQNMMDTSIVQELVDSGFIKQIYGS